MAVRQVVNVMTRLEVVGLLTMAFGAGMFVGMVLMIQIQANKSAEPSYTTPQIKYECRECVDGEEFPIGEPIIIREI